VTSGLPTFTNWISLGRQDRCGVSAIDRVWSSYSVNDQNLAAVTFGGSVTL
jgi:hypothetical protein